MQLITSKPSSLFYLLTCYLLSELGSSEKGLLHISSPLLSSVHLKVGRLIVSIINWLVIGRVDPLRLLFLPWPDCTPLSIRRSLVKDSSSLLLTSWSLTSPMTVCASRVSVPSTFPSLLVHLLVRCLSLQHAPDKRSTAAVWVGCYVDKQTSLHIADLSWFSPVCSLSLLERLHSDMYSCRAISMPQ